MEGAPPPDSDLFLPHLFFFGFLGCLDSAATSGLGGGSLDLTAGAAIAATLADTLVVCVLYKVTTNFHESK